MRWLVPALISLATTAAADHELDGRDIGQGRLLYVENCASCHGMGLEGQPNWRSANADGILPAPPIMQRGIRGITTTNCCLNILNLAVKARWPSAVSPTSTAACLRLRVLCPTLRFGLCWRISDQHGLNVSKRFKPAETLRTEFRDFT
jgi:hypothetical protein